MTQFSANLGFLWADRPLPLAIHAAKAGYGTPNRAPALGAKKTNMGGSGHSSRKGSKTPGGKQRVKKADFW